MARQLRCAKTFISRDYFGLESILIDFEMIDFDESKYQIDSSSD